MLITNNPQMHFSDLPFSDLIFKKDHPLLKLNDAIDWSNLLEYLGQFYNHNKGRPSTPLRAKTGTLIIKYLKNLPDRDCVAYVGENIYAQRFCGLLPSQASGYMNPKNDLTNFRSQIGVKGLSFINEILIAASTKKPLKKGNKLIIDTTCVPMDIHYPTDIRLLERCRREIIDLFKQAKKLGLNIPFRTYSRKARGIFGRFSKLSRPNEKSRRKIHKQMLQFVSRNFKQLVSLRKVALSRFNYPHIKNMPVTLEFLKRLKDAQTKIISILHQQKQIYHNAKHINSRIVSFHKDYVRPIVRGKFPLPTEFGPKVLLAVVKGYSYVVNIFNDNVADVSMVVSALRWFKQSFGHLPKELLGDRGFFSRLNVHLLNILSIRSGLQQRGKSPDSSHAQRRMARQRLPIEARISLAKRKFGWNRCRAKNPLHEQYWIRLGASAMNAHLIFCKSP